MKCLIYIYRVDMYDLIMTHSSIVHFIFTQPVDSKLRVISAGDSSTSDKDLLYFDLFVDRENTSDNLTSFFLK